MSVNERQQHTDMKFADVLACTNVSDTHSPRVQGPGILDLIAAEAVDGWVVGRVSWATDHASVDSLHAAGLVSYPLKLSNMQLYQVSRVVNNTCEKYCQ